MIHLNSDIRASVVACVSIRLSVLSTAVVLFCAAAAPAVTFVPRLADHCRCRGTCIENWIFSLLLCCTIESPTYTDYKEDRAAGYIQYVVGIFKPDNRKLNWRQWIDNQETVCCLLGVHTMNTTYLIDTIKFEDFFGEDYRDDWNVWAFLTILNQVRGDYWG